MHPMLKWHCKLPEMFTPEEVKVLVFGLSQQPTLLQAVPEDNGSFFEPSNDKPYRHPTFYKVPEGVKYL